MNKNITFLFNEYKRTGDIPDMIETLVEYSQQLEERIEKLEERIEKLENKGGHI